jgi:antitoxin component of MazEF toxin-antitoxin module
VRIVIANHTTIVAIVIVSTLTVMTLQYVMRIQGCKIKGSSLVVTIPHAISDVLDLERGQNVILELAVDNSKGKSEKVCVIRRMQTDQPNYKVNVVT